MKKGFIIALATALACTLVFALPIMAVPGGDSVSNSANKVVAQGSTIEIFGTSDAEWEPSGETLESNMLANEDPVTIEVSNVSGFRVFQMIQIGDEVLRITGINYEDYELDVSRGVWCTSAAAHSVGDAINVQSIGDTIKLLEVTGKFSDPKDVLIQFTAESALFTKVKGQAKYETEVFYVSQAEAFAQVLVWVEIDGNPVPVTNNEDRGGQDDGTVVFDNRAFGIKTLLKDLEQEEFIELYIATRSAHAFNWVAVDVGQYDEDYYGNGKDLTIEVKAALVTDKCELNSGAADAEAAVGKRTVVVEPIKMATGSNY